jgi:anti-sigma B factor antagonist
MAVLDVRHVGAATVAVAGEIDASTVHRLESALDGLGAHPVIRCTGCSFIDSAGVTALLRLRRRVMEIGGTVTLADPSPAVRRVLEVAGLVDVFRVVDAPTEAPTDDAG